MDRLGSSLLAGYCQHTVTLTSTNRTHIFHKHGTLIAAPVAILQGWDKSSWVELEVPFRFGVRIDLNILVVQLLALKRDPDSLYERTVAMSELSASFLILEHTRNSCRIVSSYALLHVS